MFELFTKVSLRVDIKEQGLQKGDVAVIVEFHPEIHGEKGYTLEVFNAVGDTIATPTVKESQIEPLTYNEILQVRQINPGLVAEPKKNYKSH